MQIPVVLKSERTCGLLSTEPVTAARGSVNGDTRVKFKGLAKWL